MKRGTSYLILTSLVISIFMGSLINVNPVNAYKSLSVGDQLLYEADYNYIYDYDNRVLYHTDLSPSYYSYWDINHNELTSIEKHSFLIQADYGSNYDTRHTMTYQDTFRNDYWDHYDYDYYSAGWNWKDGDAYNGLQYNSYTNMDSISYNSPIINLDWQYMFPAMSFSYQMGQSYTINGVLTGFTVDVYTYSYSSSGYDNFTYYDINYRNYYDYSYAYTYYIDNATGFVLGYEYFSSNQEWANFAEEWSNSLGTNITYDYYYYDYSEYHAYLTQTTAAFNAVTDADLPGIQWNFTYNYILTGDKNYIDIYFWLYDSSKVDLDIYKEGTYIETLYGLTSGYHSYRVYYNDIPVGYNSHEFKIIATDVHDSSHQTIWSLWMNDYRLDWPQINGPAGEAWYEIGTSKVYYWTLKDENYDPHYFELKVNGMIIDQGIWNVDKLLGYNAQTEITAPGDYVIKIFANDTMGHESFKQFTIHADYTPDTDPPGITNPADIYMKPGDPKEINWILTDDNPLNYTVYRNETILFGNIWNINNFNVNVSLDTLALGIWIFVIEVYDTYGNVAHDEVVVYVTEEGTNPTTPTTPTPSNSNTVTLDAPEILFTVLGFLSITAITVFVKKRK